MNIGKKEPVGISEPPKKERFLVERKWCETCGGCGSVAGVDFSEPRDPNPRAKCHGCGGARFKDDYTPITDEEWETAWAAIEATETKKQTGKQTVTIYYGFWKDRRFCSFYRERLAMVDTPIQTLTVEVDDFSVCHAGAYAIIGGVSWDAGGLCMKIERDRG